MDERTLNELESHPAVVEIKRKQQAEKLEQRREWAAEREQAQAAKKKNLPPLQKTLDEKRAAAEKARQALKRAEIEANAAYTALRNEENRLTRAEKKLEAELRESADPLIEQTIEFFRDKFYELRDPGNLQKVAGRGHFSLIKFRYIPGEKESNAGAIRAAMDYCSAAIETLEKMKLEPAMDATKVQELGEGLPGIDTFEVYEEPQPFKGVEGGFLHPRTPSKTERLTTKANRVIYG